jgi:hypothetical protein
MEEEEDILSHFVQGFLEGNYQERMKGMARISELHPPSETPRIGI